MPYCSNNNIYFDAGVLYSAAEENVRPGIKPLEMHELNACASQQKSNLYKNALLMRLLIDIQSANRLEVAGCL